HAGNDYRRLQELPRHLRCLPRWPVCPAGVQHLLCRDPGRCLPDVLRHRQHDAPPRLDRRLLLLLLLHFPGDHQHCARHHLRRLCHLLLHGRIAPGHVLVPNHCQLEACLHHLIGQYLLWIANHCRHPDPQNHCQHVPR
ncbi:hypothetical protein BGZ52_010221, partial [Haplosporangium bisporale]